MSADKQIDEIFTPLIVDGEDTNFHQIPEARTNLKALLLSTRIQEQEFWQGFLDNDEINKDELKVHHKIRLNVLKESNVKLNTQEEK